MQRMKRIAKRTTWALQRQILKGDLYQKIMKCRLLQIWVWKSMTISAGAGSDEASGEDRPAGLLGEDENKSM